MFILTNITQDSIAHAYILEGGGHDCDKLRDLSLGSDSLSNKDRLRLSKMRSKKRQRQFMLTRYVLSECLYRLTKQRHVVDSQESGQPYIENSNFYCSISHSADFVAVAISNQGAIGIDIEQNRRRNLSAIVSTFFHAEEVDVFDQLPEERKMNWFYEQWTRKEATVKAAGKGLSRVGLAAKADSSLQIQYHQTEAYALSCVHHGEGQVQLYDARLLTGEPWLRLGLFK